MCFLKSASLEQVRKHKEHRHLLQEDPGPVPTSPVPMAATGPSTQAPEERDQPAIVYCAFLHNHLLQCLMPIHIYTKQHSDNATGERFNSVKQRHNFTTIGIPNA